VRNERKGKPGHKGREIAPGQMPGDEKGHQCAGRKKKIVEQKRIQFIGAQHLEGQTDEKGPAAGFLIMRPLHNLPKIVN